MGKHARLPGGAAPSLARARRPRSSTARPCSALASSPPPSPPVARSHCSGPAADAPSPDSATLVAASTVQLHSPGRARARRNRLPRTPTRCPKPRSPSPSLLPPSSSRHPLSRAGHLPHLHTTTTTVHGSYLAHPLVPMDQPPPPMLAPPSVQPSASQGQQAPQQQQPQQPPQGLPSPLQGAQQHSQMHQQALTNPQQVTLDAQGHTPAGVTAASLLPSRDQIPRSASNSLSQGYTPACGPCTDYKLCPTQSVQVSAVSEGLLPPRAPDSPHPHPHGREASRLHPPGVRLSLPLSLSPLPSCCAVSTGFVTRRPRGSRPVRRHGRTREPGLVIGPRHRTSPRLGRPPGPCNPIPHILILLSCTPY